MKIAVTDSPAGKELHQKIRECGVEVDFLSYRSAIQEVIEYRRTGKVTSEKSKLADSICGAVSAFGEH